MRVNTPLHVMMLASASQGTNTHVFHLTSVAYFKYIAAF